MRYFECSNHIHNPLSPSKGERERSSRKAESKTERVEGVRSVHTSKHAIYQTRY